MNNPKEEKKRDDFERRIAIKLGPGTKSLDFDHEGQTPVFQFYEDDDDGVISPSKEAEEDPTPISFDKLIGAEVSLPRGTRWYQESCRHKSRTMKVIPLALPTRSLPLIQRSTKWISPMEGEQNWVHVHCRMHVRTM